MYIIYIAMTSLSGRREVRRTVEAGHYVEHLLTNPVACHGSDLGGLDPCPSGRSSLGRQGGWAFAPIASTKRNRVLSRLRASHGQPVQRGLSRMAGTQCLDADWRSFKAFVPKDTHRKQGKGDATHSAMLGCRVWQWLWRRTHWLLSNMTTAMIARSSF